MYCLAHGSAFRTRVVIYAERARGLPEGRWTACLIAPGSAAFMMVGAGSSVIAAIADIIHGLATRHQRLLRDLCRSPDATCEPNRAIGYCDHVLSDSALRGESVEVRVGMEPLSPFRAPLEIVRADVRWRWARWTSS